MATQGFNVSSTNIANLPGGSRISTPHPKKKSSFPLKQKIKLALLTLALIFFATLWRQSYIPPSIDSLFFGSHLSIECKFESSNGTIDSSFWWWTSNAAKGLSIPNKNEWFFKYGRVYYNRTLNGLADPSAGYLLPILGDHLLFERASKSGSPVLYIFSVRLPYWLIAATFAAIASLRWTLLIRRRRKQKQNPSEILCPRCNYDLRATPTKCPECGYEP